MSENPKKFGDVDVDVLIEFPFLKFLKIAILHTMGNSGKNFEGMEEMRAKVNFTVRNPHLVFIKVSKVVENALKFEEMGSTGKISCLKNLFENCRKIQECKSRRVD